MPQVRILSLRFLRNAVSTLFMRRYGISACCIHVANPDVLGIKIQVFGMNATRNATRKRTGRGSLSCRFSHAVNAALFFDPQSPSTSRSFSNRNTTHYAAPPPYGYSKTALIIKAVYLMMLISLMSLSFNPHPESSRIASSSGSLSGAGI